MGNLMREGSLGEILLRSQIITEDDIGTALAEQQATGCRFGEALLRLGIVTQEDIDWALSSQLNIPYVRLKPEMLDRAAAEQVPAGFARHHHLVPLIRIGAELSIAIADPLNAPAIEELGRLTGCQITVSVAQLDEIRAMLDLLYGAAEDGDSLGFASGMFSPEELAAANGDLTGGALLDLLLGRIVSGGLASLTLQPEGERVRVAGRQGGRVQPIGDLAATYYPDLLRRIKAAAHLDGGDQPAAGELPYLRDGQELRFRVAFLPAEGGGCVTLRLRTALPFPGSWSGLGLTPQQEESVRGLCRLERGLVLVAARDADERHRLLDLFLEEIPTAGRSVLLLGDCLGRSGKRFPRVPLPAGRGGAAGFIAAAQEHEPDLLVIEDLTDGAALAEATKAAMGNRLVVAGLDLPDAAGLVRCLATLWHRSHFLPVSLKGVVACTGVRTLCPACRTPHQPDRDELAPLGLSGLPETCYRPAGCPACGQTGFAGRTYLLDVLTMTGELRALFESAGDTEGLVGQLAGRGGREAERAGLELVRRGEIALDEFIAALAE